MTLSASRLVSLSIALRRIRSRGGNRLMVQLSPRVVNTEPSPITVVEDLLSQYEGDLRRRTSRREHQVMGHRKLSSMPSVEPYVLRTGEVRPRIGLQSLSALP